MAQAAAAYIFRHIAVALARAGVSKAFITAIAGPARWALQASLVLAANVAISMAMMPRQSVPDGRQPIRQATPRRKSAFGRNRGTGAYLNYAVDGGDSIDVLAIHDGRIAGIDQYYLHDDLVTLGTGPLGSGFVQGDPSTHLYYEAIYIDTRLGTATQTAFQRSIGRLPSGVWSSSHRALGVACLELLCLGPKAERLPKVYPLGLPRPSVVYRAQYCYDWRDPAQDINDWTTWTPGSRNPILQLATYLINPAIPDPAAPDRCLGQGEAWDVAIAPKLAEWTQAANDCDEAKAKKGGGTEPAYQCDFEYHVGEDGADTIARILASCDGWLGEAGDGSLVPYVGKLREPSLTLENDWIIEWDIQSALPDENRKNVLLPFWTDPDQKFTRVEGARRYDAANIALVGKQRIQPVELVQIQSHGQLQRILKRLMDRMTAPKRGTLVCDLRALQALGQRWVKLPADFPITSLQGAILELDDIKVALAQDRVSIPFIQIDPDIDDWDPDADEGAAPPAPSEVSPQPVPVIDTADVAASVATETLFGGDRAAVATLVFPSPFNTFDLGASTVDVPRTELSWIVRWRPSAGGEWVEAPFEGDPISGDQENGYVVTLKTPALPRAALDVQIAAIGPQRGRGAWSETIAIDVVAATAPALDQAQNVTAIASVEASPNGVRRPVLTVGFDPITDPQAQLVIIAVKAAGAAESTYAQIDMVEPRLGGRKTYNLPFGETVDVGVQVWAKWRTPSDWVSVPNVAIPDELVATGAAGDLSDLLDVIQQDALDLLADIDELTSELDQEVADRAAAVQSARDTARREVAELSQDVAAEVAGILAFVETEGERRLSEDERIERLVIGVSTRLDGDEFYSASQAEQTFLAIDDFDSTLAAADLSVNSGYLALLSDVDDIAVDYLSQADAALTYATQTGVADAIATSADSLAAEIAVIDGGLTDLSDIVDVIDTDLADLEGEVSTISSGLDTVSSVASSLTRALAQVEQDWLALLAGALTTISATTAAAATDAEAAFNAATAYRAEFTAELDEAAPGTLANAIATIESYAVGQSDINSSLAAWGLLVGSEYSITTRLDDVEDDFTALDDEVGTLSSSVAIILLDYITSTDQDDAFAAFGLNLASTYNVTTRFGAIETDVGDLEADVDAANALIDVNASTLAAVDRALAEFSQDVAAYLASALAASETSVQAAVSDTESVVRRVESLRAVLVGDYMTAADIVLDFVSFAGLDSALASADITANATISGLLTDVSDLEGDVSGILADYLSEAEAATLYLAKVDFDGEFLSAFAAVDITANATLGALADDVDDNSAASSIFLDAFTDGSGNALASIELIASAGGGLPAFISLLDGNGLNAAVIAAAEVVLANLGSGENEIQQVLIAAGGNVEIVNDLLIGATGSLRQYDDSDVLRILVGENDSADRGIFTYDADGDPLIIIDIDNEVYSISPGMFPDGHVYLTRSGSLAQTTIWATTCTSGQCAPTSKSDFVDIDLLSGAFDHLDGYSHYVEADCTLTIHSNADCYRWLYFRHRLRVVDAVTGSHVAAITGWQEGETGCAQAEGNASAVAVSANRVLPESFFITGGAWFSGGSTYANGLKVIWEWEADNSDIAACAEGVNRNSGARDAKISASLQVRVVKKPYSA